MSDTVDWDLAARVGIRLLRPGPKLSHDERTAAVARLRQSAQRSVDLVAAASQLPAAEDANGVTLVVDRAGVVRANAAVMSMVMSQLDQQSHNGLASRLTGGGAGVVLAFIATSVLGQYEPFSDRLLLSAPSVEAVRAEIKADPSDFALWVCLHEQTHRHQFAAAPWLREYLIGLMRRVIELETEDKPSDRGRDKGNDADLGLISALSSPAVAPVLGEVTAVMSLLEGYADMLMDMAGAPVIPTLPTIRAAIDARRKPARPTLKTIVGRAIGFASKIDQYVDGKVFCESVCRQVGLDGLNTAFSGPDAVPTKDELRDPSAWVTRRFGDHVDVVA